LGVVCVRAGIGLVPLVVLPKPGTPVPTGGTPTVSAGNPVPEDPALEVPLVVVFPLVEPDEKVPLALLMALPLVVPDDVALLMPVEFNPEPVVPKVLRPLLFPG